MVVQRERAVSAPQQCMMLARPRLRRPAGDALEVHADAVRGGARVLVHDDLLATGGTAGALCGLVEQAGGVVAGCAFVIELAFLHGRDRLSDYDVHSLLAYDSE